MPPVDLPKLHTSERVTFKRCRQKWYWAYVMGLDSRIPSPALRLGDLAHKSLAAYYRPGRKRGPHPVRTFRRLYAEDVKKAGRYGAKDINEEWIEAGELGEAMLTGYVDRYGTDPEIEVIYPEHGAAVKMTDRGGKPFLYVVRFDAVIIYQGRVGLFEHKTAKSINTNKLVLDEQPSSYWGVGPEALSPLKILEDDEDLDMILYNFLRKGLPDPRPRNDRGQYLNQDGAVSKQQPPPLFVRYPLVRDEDDRRAVLRRIRAEQREIRLARAGKLDIYKNPIPDRCSWDCPFYDMCELHETGADWRSFAKDTLRVRDPYEELYADVGLPGPKKGGKVAHSR